MHRLVLGLDSSGRVLGNRVRPHVNSKGKIPSVGGSEEGGTLDAASLRTELYWPKMLSKRNTTFVTKSRREQSLHNHVINSILWLEKTFYSCMLFSWEMRTVLMLLIMLLVSFDNNDSVTAIVV